MKKKILRTEEIPEFHAAIEAMPLDSKIFVDLSLEIADYIHHLLESRGLKQKDLAEKLGKSEAEVSKLLAGLHNYTLRTISKLQAALDSPIVSVPRYAQQHAPTISTEQSMYHKVPSKPMNRFPVMQFEKTKTFDSDSYQNQAFAA